jgi:hypothetical protein
MSIDQKLALDAQIRASPRNTGTEQRMSAPSSELAPTFFTGESCKANTRRQKGTGEEEYSRSKTSKCLRVSGQDWTSKKWMLRKSDGGKAAGEGKKAGIDRNNTSRLNPASIVTTRSTSEKIGIYIPIAL